MSSMCTRNHWSPDGNSEHSLKGKLALNQASHFQLSPATKHEMRTIAATFVRPRFRYVFSDQNRPKKKLGFRNLKHSSSTPSKQGSNRQEQKNSNQKHHIGTQEHQTSNQEHHTLLAPACPLCSFMFFLLFSAHPCSSVLLPAPPCSSLLLSAPPCFSLLLLLSPWLLLFSSALLLKLSCSSPVLFCSARGFFCSAAKVSSSAPGISRPAPELSCSAPRLFLLCS